MRARLRAYYRLLAQPGDSGEAVEAAIEAQYSLDAVLLHDGDVHGVARRQPAIAEHDFFGTLGGRCQSGLRGVGQRVEGTNPDEIRLYWIEQVRVLPSQ